MFFCEISGLVGCGADAKISNVSQSFEVDVAVRQKWGANAYDEAGETLANFLSVYSR